jgi:hypothetical protein
MIILLQNRLTLHDSVMISASRRFEEAFRGAWARIPADSQEIILDYFRRCPGRVYMCYRMDFGEHPQEPWGRCSWYYDQTILTFLAPFVERAEPIEALVSVIAHELAHCYRRGNGTWTDNLDEEEKITRRTTEAWGFIEPAPGDRSAWNEAIEEWKKHRSVEFSEYTERLWLQG